jgi:hypothetical protein
MGRPKVNIILSQGGLGLIGPSDFGMSALLVAAPVAPLAGYGVAFTLKNSAQAKLAFAQVGNEAVVKAIVEGFYAEAPEGTPVQVLAMAATTTLSTLLTSANADKALNLGGGRVRLLSAVKFPGVSYVPTVANGFDGDVHTAVTAGQLVADDWFSKKQPFRFFVEGFGFTTAADAKDYVTGTTPNAHIVVGNIDSSTAQVTLLAMGRAAKVSPQENIGKVKSNSLTIKETAVVNIGATLVESMAGADLDSLYDKRYISFEKNKIASGYIFSDDNSLVAPTSDYNNLRYGRVIDNATRVVFSTYYLELKNDVDVDEKGRIALGIEKALENAVEQAIDQNMRVQLSKKKDSTADVQCLVNPDAVVYAALYNSNNIPAPNFNILQTNTVYLFVRLKPKGCLKYINIYLGYTATS